MSWRPDAWKSLRWEVYGADITQAYEDGADAMLEALKANSTTVGLKGWIIHIPEEVQELDGEDLMPRVDGKPFRCECGCNVFRQVRKDPNHYKCNACGATYEGTLKKEVTENGS